MDKVVRRFVLAIVCLMVFLYLGLHRAWFDGNTAFGLGAIVGTVLVTSLCTYLDLRNKEIDL
mgnify:CR=1 FL=1